MEYLSDKKMPRKFNWFGLRKKSVAEQKDEHLKSLIARTYEIHRIPKGDTLQEARKKLEQIDDPNKRRVVLLNFDRTVAQLKRRL